jgi:hypothetical protein
MPLGRNGQTYSEVNVELELDWTPGETPGGDLVFTEEGAQGQLSYWSKPLRNGSSTVNYRIPPRDEGVTNKLYIWNPDGKLFTIRKFRIAMERMYVEGLEP